MDSQTSSDRKNSRRHFGLALLVCLLGLAALPSTGCQSAIFTIVYLINGTDVAPKHDIFNKKKGPLKAAIVCRSMANNPMEVQNAPAKIAQMVSMHIGNNAKNKKLEMIDQVKVEAWLDNCNNEYDSFREIGLDKSIEADIIIGIDLLGFQLRDPSSPYLMQGRAHVQVQAIEVASGKILANEILTIIDPPGAPISAGPGSETMFRPQFINVVATQVAILFHPHDPNRTRRIDADNLEMLRYD